jgi:hypothetical protein
MLAKQVDGVKAIIVRHVNLECEGFGSTSAQSISFTSLHLWCLQPRSRFWLTVASCSHFSYTLHLPPENSHPNFSHTTLTHTLILSYPSNIRRTNFTVQIHSTAIRSGKLNSHFIFRIPIQFQYPITFYFTFKTRFQCIHANSAVLISSCTLVFEFINTFVRLLPFARLVGASYSHRDITYLPTPKNYRTD